jgi:hypothetical protein
MEAILTLPGADRDEITAFLENHPGWDKQQMHRGGQIWHNTVAGASVAVPIVGHYADDDELLATAADTIARIELGLNPGDFHIAIRRLAEQQRGLVIPREVLEQWAGHSLTDAEVVRLGETIPYSSIPDTVETIVHATMGVPDRSDEEDGD